MLPIQIILRKNSLSSCYAREIERHWKIKELQRQSFGFKSPQLHLRNHLIKWVKNVSDNIKLSYRTFHLAVYILDMFMDKHSITKERLGFVSLVCLMLAAKFEEVDSKVPKITQLNQYDGCRYSNREFIKVEVMLLKFLDFGLTQPTVAHFAEYYAAAAIIPNDLRSQRTSLYALCEVAQTVISELLYVSLKEVKLLLQPPSQVAAACVLCARRRMNLSPAWTLMLVNVTGYTEDGLNYCAHLLLRKLQEYHRRKLSAVFSLDHGYNLDTWK